MSLNLSLLVFFGMAGVLNYFVTKQFISYAKRKQITDIPTERSSHTVPTPRGGGGGFVVTTLALFSCSLIFRGPQGVVGGVWVFIIALLFSLMLGSRVL